MLEKFAVITKSKEKLEEEWHKLLFGVMRSIRYYLHRRRFFEKLEVCAGFLVVGSGAVAVL